MEYTKDQINALNIIKDWWKTYDRNNFLAIAGYSGTGKTTLIADLPHHLKKVTGGIPQLSYATLTAKAALVLRNKGIPATTIHSLIYDTIVVQDKVTKKIKYIFRKKEFLNCDLIIIDESSMVSEELYNDLKSFGIPILFIGDSFQLPPVTGDFNLMTDKYLSYTMKEIMRQEQGNEIIIMSMKIRNGDNIPYRNGKTFHKVHRNTISEETYLQYDQIITGKNKTRIELNKRYRNLIGHNSELPIVNDKMIFLRNNYEDNVFNGQQVIIKKKPKELGKNKLNIQFEDIIDGSISEVIVTTESINNILPPNNITKEINLIDYGYALSVHKCVTGDTNIFTDCGIKKIENYNGELVYNGVEFVKPVNFFKNKGSLVKTIKTKNGFKLSTTLNHNHMLLNEYCKLEKRKTNDLKLGDVVLIPKNIYEPNKQYITKKSKYIPNILNEEFGEWLGLFIADGCLFSNRKNGFRLFKRNEDVVNKFAYLTNKLFNVNYAVKPNDNYKSKCYQYEIFNKNIATDLFENYPCLIPNKKFIPNEIKESPKTVQQSFLRGIFEDGYVDKNNQIVFSTSIEHIAYDIQLLLLNNNIVSKVKDYHNKKGKTIWYVTVLNDFNNEFVNKIGFISSYKNNKTKIFKRRNSHESFKPLKDVIINIYNEYNKKVYPDKYRNILNRGGCSIQLAKQFVEEMVCFSNSNNYQNLKYILDNFYLDKINYISETYKEDTFCFEIKENHMFVQNGILSGNSQGSEWDKVLLYDDLFAISNSEMRNRWLYTAITRASNEVLWVC